MRAWERESEVEAERRRESRRVLGSWFDEGCKENVNQTITLHAIDWNGREVISTEKKGKLRPLLMFWYKVFCLCTHLHVTFVVCPVGACMFMQEMLCQKRYFLENLCLFVPRSASFICSVSQYYALSSSLILVLHDCNVPRQWLALLPHSKTVPGSVPWGPGACLWACCLFSPHLHGFCYGSSGWMMDGLSFVTETKILKY